MMLLYSLGLQVPPQKVFGPSKPTPNTFLEGTWSPRDCVYTDGLTFILQSRIRPVFNCSLIKGS